jgi:ParB family chromosome partitioning protein
MLQPINVRPLADGKYELISGERRLRAARVVGMSKIPCVVMNVSDRESALFAIIENVQRQNLDFFEEAVAIEKLMVDHGMTQEDISKKLGKAQSTLSNKLRLLRLPEEIRDKISCNGLTERHARALLTLPDNATRNRILDIIIERHLTVSEAERLINDASRRKKSKNRPQMKAYKDMRIFLNTLNHAVDVIRRAGIEADTAKSETDEYFEYVIRISKPDDATIATITTQAV